MTEPTVNSQPELKRPNILHVSKREMLRPLRDQVLRVSGYDVDSTLSAEQALTMFFAATYALVLIDVEGEHGIPEAEQLCSAIKTARPQQLVAFVCNWRVAILTDCPDEVVRTEFNPEAFVAGVGQMLEKNPPANSNAGRTTFTPGRGSRGSSKFQPSEKSSN